MAQQPARSRLFAALVVGLIAALFGLLAAPAGPAAAVECDPGKYLDGGICVEAEPGTYAPGDDAAYSCPLGTYQPSSGAVSCLLAPPGTFVDLEAAVAATPCPPGTYQPSSGAVSCLLAPPGTFADLEAAVAATPCPPGTEQPLLGQTSCVAIAAYQFVGFAHPVDNDVMNAAQAGRAIPLKWRVLTPSGVPVTDLASVTVRAASLACLNGTATADLLEEYATGSSGLQNLGDGYYQWNWKSPKSYAGSCKTLTVALSVPGGPLTASAAFSFIR
jgi:hypothetical protein